MHAHDKMEQKFLKERIRETTSQFTCPSLSRILLEREALYFTSSSPIMPRRSGAVAAPPRRKFFFCPIQIFFSFLTILFRSNHESGLSFSRKSTVKRRSKFEV